MGAKLTPTFLLLTVALVLWASSLGLSSHLAKQHGHGASHRGKEQPVKLSEKLEALRSAADAAPQSIESRLHFAAAIREEAYEKSSGELLMEAVQQYARVLEMSPENAEALYGMATLCLEAGITDKALEYYPRYLKIRPDDIRASTDYSLALLQANQIAEARERLTAILAVDREFVPARLTLALSYKLEGNLERARELANEAKSFVKEDAAKARIDEFMKALETVPGGGVSAAPSGTTAAPVPTENTSPAEVVAGYFRNHTIVGPKVVSITWPELTVAQISLKNFPVEQMPPFAKDKFIAGVKSALQVLPESVKVRLVDAESSRELLVIDVPAGSK